MFKRTASGYSEGSVFASLFRSRGVQMGKSAILKKIHNAAKNYQRYLAGKTFMYVCEGKSIEVDFIFCKQTNAAKYEIISYKGDKEIDIIPEEIRLKISDDLV